MATPGRWRFFGGRACGRGPERNILILFCCVLDIHCARAFRLVAFATFRGVAFVTAS